MNDKQDTYHHGDLRAELIAVTTEMIAEEGVESVSMRKLSQRIGVSRTAAYRHFADKTELLAAVAEQGFNRLTEASQHIRLQNDRDIVERLEKMYVSYVQFAAENPALYRLMFGQKITDWKAYPSLVEAASEALDETVFIIQTCQEQHLVKPGSPRDLAYVLFALLHGQAMLLIDGRLPGKASIEQLARRAVQVFLEGAGLTG